ncbi:MAG: RNA methyltransferase [Clostridiales bacterium]|jgi:TrmH family RNA methyltransferase|nr:RNA methyltransferase [Clostridiales bacterium]
MLTRIESLSNKYIKKLVSLKDKKGRLEHNAFIVEGERVAAQIPEDWPVESYLFSESREETSFEAYERRAPVYILSERAAARVSGLVTPPGVMAVCRMPLAAPALAFKSEPPLVLICDRISDPGNLGTLVRAADAAAGSVLMTRGCADMYSPKVLRAMSGSIFNVPIIAELTADEVISLCAKNNTPIAAAHPQGRVMPWDARLSAGCAIAIGSEAHGLSEGIARAAASFIKIPMPGRAESLNAAMAGSVLLYEAVRQRAPFKRAYDNRGSVPRL